MANIQKLALEDLQLGMYVTEIETKKSGVKVKAGGKVTNLSLIEKMKAQQICYVYVDYDLSTHAKEEILPAAEIKEPIVEKEATQSKIPKRSECAPRSMAAELNNAETLFGEAKQLQENFFDSVMQNETIDLEVVEGVTSEIMASIFRNEDAMLFMTRMKEKDAYLFEHAINTSILMTRFASYLEYEEGMIQEMAIGAFMLDIGKTLIPKNILNKSGKLEAEEFAKIKKHVEYSKKIIEGIPGVSPVSVDVAAVHHERLDGSGYPDGLKGDEIPTWGRMVAIVDTYDAMTTNRRYQGACQSTKAFRAMFEAPHQYDNELVQQFIKCIGIYPIGSLVKLKSGLLAMVFESCPTNPLKPIIVSFYNLKQRHRTEVRKIDLLKTDKEEIEMSIRSEDLDIDVDRNLVESLFAQAQRS